MRCRPVALVQRDLIVLAAIGWLWLFFDNHVHRAVAVAVAGQATGFTWRALSAH